MIRKVCFIVTGIVLYSSFLRGTNVIQEIMSLEYGDIVTKVEYLGEYGRADAVQFLGLAVKDSPNNIKTSTGFVLFRFSYLTQTYGNLTVEASGLIGVPKKGRIKGLLSWQHGTNTYRPASISMPSPGEGIGINALFASNGFIVVAADYVGLGISEDIHPYYHWASTIPAIIDLIKIGGIILDYKTGGSNRGLFLAGFSQGAGASVATHRELERSQATNFLLKGTAAIAGAYDLDGVSFPYGVRNSSSEEGNVVVNERGEAFGKGRIRSIIYMGYAANAYAHIYDQPISSMIRAPYDRRVRGWFDGTKDQRFYEQNLPRTAQELLQVSFLAALETGDTTHWAIQAMRENETYKWVPVQKLRFYFGAADLDVSPQDSKRAFHYMKKRGGNVELFNLGKYKHDEVILQALPLIQKWFDELSQ